MSYDADTGWNLNINMLQVSKTLCIIEFRCRWGQNHRFPIMKSKRHHKGPHIANTIIIIVVVIGIFVCKSVFSRVKRIQPGLWSAETEPTWCVNDSCIQYSTVFHSAQKYSTVFSIAYFWPLARSSWAIGKNKGVKMPTSSFSHQEAPKVPWTLFCIYFVPLWYLQYWSCLWQPTMDGINMQLLDWHHSCQDIIIIIYINIRILSHQHKNCYQPMARPWSCQHHHKH